MQRGSREVTRSFPQFTIVQWVLDSHFLPKDAFDIWLVQSTRLALQWILVKGFRLYSFQLPDINARYCYLLSLPPLVEIG